MNSDHQLWHKSIATIDKTKSQGLTIDGAAIQNFSHRYTNNSGSVEYMYYIKIIVNFKKTAPDPLYSVHRYVDIKQNGDDLNTYPANWINNWSIAYGVFRKKHHQLTPPPKKKKQQQQQQKQQKNKNKNKKNI